jgi:hypothetical protein
MNPMPNEILISLSYTQWLVLTLIQPNKETLEVLKIGILRLHTCGTRLGPWSRTSLLPERICSSRLCPSAVVFQEIQPRYRTKLS